MQNGTYRTNGTTAGSTSSSNPAGIPHAGRLGIAIVGLDVTAAAFATPEGFEAALDADDAARNPAVLYAYAAVSEGVPYGNFTPSVAVDVPAPDVAVPLPGGDGRATVAARATNRATDGVRTVPPAMTPAT